MNDKYLHELRHHLRCSRKTKTRLLEQFKAYQRDTIDDTPNYDQMVTMFGPPEEMARTLMEEVTQVEMHAYRRSKLRMVAAGVAACVLWVMFTAYVYWMKTIPIEQNSTITERSISETYEVVNAE